MPIDAPPCCPGAETEHLAELPHVRQFDLDLHRCRRCARPWVRAWRAGIGGWESVTADEAETLQTLEGSALRAFARAWALSFS